MTFLVEGVSIAIGSINPEISLAASGIFGFYIVYRRTVFRTVSFNFTTHQ